MVPSVTLLLTQEGDVGEIISSIIKKFSNLIPVAFFLSVHFFALNRQ